MFYGAGIPACFLILNRAKSAARNQRMVFINAKDCFERVETKNVMRDEDIERICDAFRSDENVDGFSTWATSEQVKSRRYNLLVRRYVQSGEEDVAEVSLPEAISELRAAMAKAQACDEVVARVLGGLQEGKL